MTTSRYRSIALGVLRCILELAGVDAPSIAQLPERARRSLTVLDTQVPFRYPPYAAYPIPEMLANRSWIDVCCSQYEPEVPWGADLGPGTTNQNLEQLTFADDSFDLVITGDVLEHVRLDDRALREIARILRPGGIFIFTVPHTRDQQDTIMKVLVHDPENPGADEIIGVPEYHRSPGAEEGGSVLSYRVYGTEIDDHLAALGFAVDYSCSPRPEHGVIDTELFYCRLGTVAR
ncbi:MAG: class I SAM-dependent methyltransferase [Acidimicrobiia bacterium]|nr:class I SAM-dependent methyltransferase [Acidimicrobiia bacterium]